MAGATLQWFERPLTYRDLDGLPESDSVRYEVIDGELYMAPFPGIAHQHAASQLLVIIGTYLQQHPLGQVFTSGTKVVLDEPTGVGPDLVYVAREHFAALRADGFYGPPDLIVEVLSSRPDLDRVVKHRKYAAAGVPRYWILDPQEQTLQAFVLLGGRYSLEYSGSRAEHYQPALFPGLVSRLARLWP